MTNTRALPEDAQKRLKWPLRLTYWGMFAERITRAFWPFWTILLFVFASLFLGLHEVLPVEPVWFFG